MKNDIALFPLIGLTALFASAAVVAAPQCDLRGHYGYNYSGTTLTPAGQASLTETGYLRIRADGSVSGVGQLVFLFQDFAGQGPLWLHLEEIQSDGQLQPDPPAGCSGQVSFTATATVVQSSNPALVAPGTIFFADQPRAIAWTASGRNGNQLDMISISPGTLASGHARKQRN